MSKSAAPTAVGPAPSGSCFAIVCAKWNSEITDRLLAAAVETLKRAEVGEDRITVVRVPGTFELPVAASRLASSGRFDAVICLGVVIKGDTDHDRYINASVAHALQTIGCETGVPTLFGVLTVNDFEQAAERAGGRHGNKGEEAAAAAIEMAQVLRTLAKKEWL
ncbi:MAG: 6,7-dimethyl-8-ribityllumazine synthase [Planctomycetota bacterium]|nr:6,7-dimethyl-8-ribityllumazine synthase [Planctomycetaceae bacterium]MDQ3333387.1 6,7-dimethyl-8-ribityllumazine synthase [Planctomycetota bacterium]